MASPHLVAVQGCQSCCARPVSVTPPQTYDAAALTSLHRNVYLRKVCVHGYTFIKRSCFLGVGLWTGDGFWVCDTESNVLDQQEERVCGGKHTPGTW